MTPWQRLAALDVEQESLDKRRKKAQRDLFAQRKACKHIFKKAVQPGGIEQCKLCGKEESV